MDLHDLQFTAKLMPLLSKLNNCQGCIFENEKSAVCREVSKIAEKLNIYDCDTEPFGKRVIYILPEIDSRQISIFGLTDNQD